MSLTKYIVFKTHIKHGLSSTLISHRDIDIIVRLTSINLQNFFLKISTAISIKHRILTNFNIIKTKNSILEACIYLNSQFNRLFINFSPLEVDSLIKISFLKIYSY